VCVCLNTQQVKLGQTALREAQKAENVTKSNAAAAAEQASVEITRLQRILAQVREAEVTIEVVQQHHHATVSPAVISFGGARVDGRGAADFDTAGDDGGGGWGILKGMESTPPTHTGVPESSTKAAVRAMRERRSRSPVPTGEEAQDINSRRGCGESVGEPEENRPGVVGGIVEETNADSVRAQVSLIESLFATSGSPSKVAAGAKESGTAAGGPGRLNAERQGADANGQRGGVHGAGSEEATITQKEEVRVVKNPLMRTSAIRDTTAARTVQAVWKTSLPPSFPPSFPPSLPPIGQDADDGPEPASAKDAMGGGTLLRTSAIHDTTAVRTARAVWETFRQDADDGQPVSAELGAHFIVDKGLAHDLHSKALEAEDMGGGTYQHSNGDDAPAAAIPDNPECKSVSVCVGAAMGPSPSSRPDGRQWIFPEGCPEFNDDDVPEMEEVYQEIKVSTGM
jgi:hypothetical protein